MQTQTKGGKLYNGVVCRKLPIFNEWLSPPLKPYFLPPNSLNSMLQLLHIPNIPCSKPLSTCEGCFPLSVNLLFSLSCLHLANFYIHHTVQVFPCLTPFSKIAKSSDFYGKLSYLMMIHLVSLFRSCCFIKHPF